MVFNNKTFFIKLKKEISKLKLLKFYTIYFNKF